MIYGVSLLCGVGFTMSLFIGSLAFEETGVNLMFDERLGIIIGSLLSGIVGYVYLRMILPPRRAAAKTAEAIRRPPGHIRRDYFSTLTPRQKAM